MKIYSNFATTLDGKIAPASRELVYLGSKADLQLLRSLRNRADAVIFGSGVLRAFRRPCLKENKKPIVNAVLSRDLKGVDPNWEFFKSDQIERVLFVTRPLTAALKRKFEKSSKLVRVSSRNPERDICRYFKKRKAKVLAVEGGGELMWNFVRSDLIDDFYLTLTPKLLGGHAAPTLLEGEGFSADEIRKYKLASVRRLGDELFLRYRRGR